ncbi:MAG: DUF2851 family protein [Bacteroidales bacterium]|nr:DUF2851 family protein [Bacteroidales bacterium]
MEKLMQYIWQHRLWNASAMTTVDGRRINIIDPGTLNTDAGPDFFNAKIEIDGNVWAGNVEIHVRATDWKRHNHDKDKAYDSVILHVVEKDDAPVYRTNGELIPQMVLRYSHNFSERYNLLVNASNSLPCAAHLKDTPSLTLSEWVQTLAFERLQAKTERIRELYDSFHGSWEDVCFVTLSRNLGFGINNDAFERLARRSPLRLLHKHCDSLFQIEALLFGQAGMLDSNLHPHDAYYQHLCSEYSFLANKFTLTPMEGETWKSFRIRPQNFPHRRIAMLAHYVFDGFRLMESILNAPSEDALRQLFTIELTGYWATHYSFADTATSSHKALSNASIDIILINTVAPLYYAYASITGNYDYADKAVDLLESLKAEKNSIVDTFVKSGITCKDALTSQALIQAKREYCDTRKCIYCTIGHRLLSQAATKIP